MRPVKTALASFGMSGMVFHAPLLHMNEGFTIYKILERSGSKSSSLYPYTKIVRDYSELLRDEEIELIVVNTPDHTHFDLAKRGILAGKHIIVEKPFTLSHSEAIELAELAGKKSVMLSVFHNRRWDGDFLTVKKIIDDHLLGRIVEFESHFDRYRNFIKEDTWKEDGSTGTGNLFNLGSHLIDQAVVLFGKPDMVTADIRTMRQGSTVDDMFELWLRYEGVKVILSSSLLVREPGPRFTLHGTEGSFLKWGLDPQEESLKGGEMPGGPDWGAEKEEDWGLISTSLNGSAVRGTYETIPGCYQEYYNDIYNAIRTGKELSVTARDAALVIKIIEASLESSKTGKSVRI